MSPQAIVFLISESIRLILDRLAQQGKLNSLSQKDAEKAVQDLAAALPVALPTPEELEK